MMRLAFLSGLVAMLASAVSAQMLPVRSGEHADFSRLVIALPADVEWSVTQRGRIAALTLNLPQVRFGIEDVFKRIPRSRLARLTQSAPGTPLEMTLACDCEVKGFTLPDRRLVIDISDAPAPRIEPEPLALPLPASIYRFAAERAGQGAAPSPFILDPRYDRSTWRRKAVNPEDKAGHRDTTQRIPVPESAERTVNKNPSEQRLLDQIERAVDQGLLDSVRPVTSKPDSPHAEDVRPSAPTPDAKPGLAAQTAIDRELADIRDILRGAGYDSTCLPADDVALSAWGSDDSFSDQTSAWRSRLFGEFDALNREAQIGLARNYLYFGFGAEAEQVLKLNGEKPGNADILIAMARILDDRPLEIANPFRGQQICDGDSALWAVLADSGLPSGTNDEAVLQALADLPAHLRILLAPRLGRIYQESGDAETAAVALRIGARAGHGPTPAIALVAAENSAMRGDRTEAVGQAAEIVASGAGEAAEALVKLVETSLKAGTAIPPDSAELAAAYAVEYRGSSLAARLQETHVVALALQGQFREAFAELARYERRNGGEADLATRAVLMDLATERAEDVVFLQFALENATVRDADTTKDVAKKIARRLIDLGFVDEARKVLTTRNGDAPGDEEVVLKAEAALAIGLPHRAMADLGDTAGTEADRLRARALLKNGRPGEASALFTKLGDSAGAARSLWLVGDRGDIPPDAAPYGEAAAAAQGLDATTKTGLPTTPLARAHALVERSEQARREISRLLDVLQVEDDRVEGDPN